MTVYLAVAALLALVYLARFGDQPRCVQCNGKGGHRPDCPLNR